MVNLSGNENIIKCQPLRPVVLDKKTVEDNKLKRILRLWEIRREFKKTGNVETPNKIHLIA